MDAILARQLELDAELVRVAGSIKVLGEVAWPAEHAARFLEGWRAGRPALPDVPTPAVGMLRELEALEGIAAACDVGHPVGEYVRRTAESFATAVKMLRRAGTPDFTRHSEDLYGRPSDRVIGSDLTLLHAAESFIVQTTAFARSSLILEDDVCVLASTVADELQAEVTAFFHLHEVRVVIDPSLASKAAAGAATIRVRGSTCFSPQDLPLSLIHI